MIHLKTKIFNRFEFLNVLFYIFPIVIALGNSAINLNTFLIIIIGFFSFKMKLFMFKERSFVLILSSFFIITIFSSFFNSFDFLKYQFLSKEHASNFFKSLTFLRFFFIFIILIKLIELNRFNIKYFFYISAGISFFLIIDLFVQAIFLVDLFGYKYIETSYRLSGFFGDEYIAGGFLQRFSLFLIFLFPFLSIRNNNNYTKLYIFITTLIVFCAILLTNNRTPLFLFVLSLFFFIFFYRKYRKFFLITLIAILFSFLILYSFNNRINHFFQSYQKQLVDIVKIFTDRDKINNNEIVIRSDYAMLFNSAIDLYKKNKILGTGIKSFRNKCFDNLQRLMPYRRCNNHPHNYYLEILVTNGVIGLLLIISIIFLTIKKFVINYNRAGKKDSMNKLIILVPFLVFIVEMFPIRSSGAFFTTGDAILIFTLLAIIHGLQPKKN